MEQINQYLNTGVDLAFKAYEWVMTYFPDETALLIGLAVSPLVAVYSRFSKKWDSLKDVQRLGIVVAVSGAAVTLNYLLKTPTVDPLLALPASTFVLSVFNQIWYKRAVRPVGQLVGNWWSKQIQKALTPVEDVRSAEIKPVDFTS